jgi:hypothetical protein
MSMISPSTSMPPIVIESAGEGRGTVAVTELEHSNAVFENADVENPVV